jgi:4-amino-4-deoxy-L-arabinose transferase-like glycosyltransferase
MLRRRWLSFALVLTLVVETVVALRSPAIALDSVTFIEIAQDLTRDPIGTMRAQDQHPGYPALVLAAHSLLNGLAPTSAATPESWIVAGRLVSILAGAGCVLLIWLIARRMYNERVADIAALLSAGLPALRQNAADALSDTPHLCAYLLAAWLAQEGLARRSWRWFLASGAASGCAFWIRPEGLSVALVVGVVLGVHLLRNVRSPRGAGVSLAALACGAMLVVGPYIILAGKLTSKKDPLSTAQKPAGFELPFMSAPPTPDVAANAAEQLASPAIAELKISPAIAITAAPTGSLASRFPGALTKYFEELGYGFGYVVWFPWFVGHFGPYRLKPLPSSLWLLLGLGLLHSALIIWLEMTAGYLAHRHVMPIIAISTPAAAAGVELLGRGFGALVRRSEWSPQWAFTISLVLVAIAVPFGTRPINSVATPVVEASDWIRQQSTPGQSVLANSIYPRFYSQLDGPLFGIEVTDLNAALRDLRPDFVLLDVDSRTYTAPESDGLGVCYRHAFATRGQGERAWHHVVVFRRVDSPISAASPGPTRH